MTTETKRRRGAAIGSKNAKKEVTACSIIGFRVTKDKRVQYDALAKRRGLTLSQLMTALLEQAAINAP